jgi:hypothetical protein
MVDAAAPQTSGDAMTGAECLQEFARSLDRCHADPRFLHRFYERFMGASPRVRELFRHTDFDRQIAVLRASLYTMMHASGNSILASSQVDAMGGAMPASASPRTCTTSGWNASWPPSRNPIRNSPRPWNAPGGTPSNRASHA